MQIGPPSSTPSLLPCFPAHRRSAARCSGPPPWPPPACAGTHASRLSSPPPSTPLAVSSPALPRAPQSSAGRHIVATVDRSEKSPDFPSLMRTSTWRTPSFHSPHPFASSPSQAAGTPPPQHRVTAAACSLWSRLHLPALPPPTPSSCSSLTDGAQGPKNRHPEPLEPPRWRSPNSNSAPRRRRQPSRPSPTDPRPPKGAQGPPPSFP